MRRSLAAASTGAAAAAVVCLVPLLHQQARLAALPPAATGAEAARTATASWTAAEKILAEWRQARDAGPRSGAALRAAESVQHLNAQACQAAAEAALKSGDTAPLPDLLGRWATLEGKAAFAWLDRHPDLSGQVLPDAAPAWAAVDPGGYAEWLAGWRPAAGQETPDHDGPESGVRLANYRSSLWLAPYDLPAAIRITMEKIHAAGMGQPVVSRLDLAPFVTSSRTAEALGTEILAHPEWLEPVPAEKPLYLLRALRECWQQFDPAGWERWAAAHPAMAEKAQHEPERPALAFLAADDPAAAADRILEATPPEQMEEAMTGLMLLWSDGDPVTAGTWLARRPEDPAKWAAVRIYALRVVEKDPLAALHWAGSIPDPDMRTLRRRVFARWANTAPAAADAWISSSGWSGPAAQEFRDILAASKPLRRPAAEPGTR